MAFLVVVGVLCLSCFPLALREAAATERLGRTHKRQPPKHAFAHALPSPHAPRRQTREQMQSTAPRPFSIVIYQGVFLSDGFFYSLLLLCCCRWVSLFFVTFGLSCNLPSLVVNTCIMLPSFPPYFSFPVPTTPKPKEPRVQRQGYKKARGSSRAVNKT